MLFINMIYPTTYSDTFFAYWNKKPLNCVDYVKLNT